MKKNAMLIFQASRLGNNIHPFVYSEVEAFCARYDHVHLVCFKYNPSIKDLDKFENLTVHGTDKFTLRNIIGGAWRFLTCYGFSDMWVAIKKKRFSIGYLKSCALMTIFGNALIRASDKVLSNASSDEEWTVEGYWLSGPALAAAWLKRKYPHIFAFSRAHSSEIDPVRNPYCICQFKKFINKYLDARYFISGWARDNYESIMPLHGVKNCENNYVMRLGIRKNEDKINPASSDGIFRIVSCSRAVPLKRLDLLAKAFVNHSYSKPIEWIHLGDGVEMEKVKTICAEKKDGFKFTFPGGMPNEAVQHYLATEPVDLFVNVSRYEGLPVSIMEAMAYGLPVVATDAGATREIVDETNGVLLPVEVTEEMIAEAIEKIVSSSDDELANYRKAAYNTWSSKYNKDTNYQELFTTLGV